MTDFYDQASEHEEEYRELAIANARKPIKKLYSVGFCHYCSEHTGAGMLFCDFECATGYQEEENARARNGG